MLCKLHSVYNTLHTLCDITQKVSNHYIVEGQFFAFNLEKNYTGQKIFTQTPSVASVTNIGYVSPKTIPYRKRRARDNSYSMAKLPNYVLIVSNTQRVTFYETFLNSNVHRPTMSIVHPSSPLTIHLQYRYISIII